MFDLVVAFITGLTTGGLSCLAVQGGLLASSLAYQIEKDIDYQTNNPSSAKPRVARPILLFLVAKLAAYSILGFLLGWAGSVLQLNPISRAILQLFIGIFMIGTAMRMFNLHPIFRFFSFEPPSFITRYIRKKAKGEASAFTPLILGTLTVLIPCGITQAMMASAMASGNPLMGALLMFSFVLGTSPVFFVIAYFATQLGARLERYFMRFVAVVILLLGIFTINTGLNLMGSPWSLNNLTNPANIFNESSQVTLLPSITSESDSGSSSRTHSGESTCGCSDISSNNGNPDPAKPESTPPYNDKVPQAQGPQIPPATPQPGKVILTINVLDDGYEPRQLLAPSEQAFQINLVTDNTKSCSRAFVIPSLNIEKILPVTGSVPINIPPQTSGTIIPYSCSMGMYTGQIVIN